MEFRAHRRHWTFNDAIYSVLPIGCRIYRVFEILSFVEDSELRVEVDIPSRVQWFIHEKRFFQPSNLMLDTLDLEWHNCELGEYATIDDLSMTTLSAPISDVLGGRKHIGFMFHLEDLMPYIRLRTNY